MTDLEERLADLERRLERRRGERKVVLERVEELEARRSEQAGKEDVCRGAAAVLSAAVDVRLAQLRERVEELVTRGLRAVFGRADFEFAFVPIKRPWGTAFEPVVRSDFRGKRIEANPTQGRAGGVADVVSFVLRVLVLSLARPRLAPVMILDEPFRHLSGGYLRGAASLLRELSREAGVQFVVVTHKAELLDVADVVYRTRLDDGVTTFLLEQDADDSVAHQKLSRRRDRPRPEPPVEKEGGSPDANLVYAETSDKLARRARRLAFDPEKKWGKDSWRVERARKARRIERLAREGAAEEAES